MIITENEICFYYFESTTHRLTVAQFNVFNNIDDVN